MANFYNQIVQINVSETVAPAPIEYQKTAALVSIGSTNLAPGTTQLIYSPASATTVSFSASVSSATWSKGVVTLVAGSTIGLPYGSNVNITVSGMTPSGYNGNYVATVVSDYTLQYPQATTLTVPTVFGSVVSVGTGLDAILKSSIGISAATWASSLVTLTLTSSIGFPVGTTIPIVVSGITPVGYNGTFTATVASTTSLTYSLTVNPGTATAFGNLITGYTNSLLGADNTWWNQTPSVPYYVFEAGSVSTANVLVAVKNYLAANPQTIYAWGFMPGIDSESTLNAFLTSYNSLGSLLKFYIPCTTGTYASLLTTAKEAMAFLQSPGADSGSEIDYIPYMHFIAAFTATPTSKLPPAQYYYTSGTTAYAPLPPSLINAFVGANVNFITTGAEGGITNTMQVPGQMLDGTPANVSYAIDWIQLHMNQALANTVINGSNSTINPLYYNQQGINTLQSAAHDVANLAAASGLCIGPVVVTQLDATVFANNLSNGVYANTTVINAVPYATYVALNPSDYANQIYAGLECAFVPQYGFNQIVFNLGITQFS